jgi:TldD protein
VDIIDIMTNMSQNTGDRSISGGAALPAALDKRYNFQFGCEIGWEIKGGKLARMFKNPSYSGITTEFWNSMDAICSRDQWTLWGTPNCGKGQPMQTMGTGHGTAPARFRNVKIGTAYKGN